MLQAPEGSPLQGGCTPVHCVVALFRVLTHDDGPAWQVVTVVGTSMGAAVIWSYLELFGDARIAKAVFVDQAPLQVRARVGRVRCSSTRSRNWFMVRVTVRLMLTVCTASERKCVH